MIKILIKTIRSILKHKNKKQYLTQYKIRCKIFDVRRVRTCLLFLLCLDIIEYVIILIRLFIKFLSETFFFKFSEIINYKKDQWEFYKYFSPLHIDFIVFSAFFFTFWYEGRKLIFGRTFIWSILFASLLSDTLWHCKK